LRKSVFPRLVALFAVAAVPAVAAVAEVTSIWRSFRGLGIQGHRRDHAEEVCNGYASGAEGRFGAISWAISGQGCSGVEWR
jgi:hypothetical protein